MEERVKQCCKTWHDGHCRLCQDIKGWGCRLLTFLPDEAPVSDHDKGLLFSKVYRSAKSIGVLDCPHYDELDIDRAVEDDEMMRQMVLLNAPLRADLLSDEICDFSNPLEFK
jgi:hypothetical protein